MAEHNTHDSRISIAKAVCIILMIVGHSGTSTEIHHFIYLFHMPAFFFISGFLLKDKYFDTPFLFVKHRFKGLWWPFIKWSLIFLALHNLLAYLHFYNNTYSLGEMAYKVVRICTLTGSEQLLGGYWFLKELLYASLLAFATMLLLRRVNNVNLFNKWGGEWGHLYFFSQHTC